ncbi:phage tail protein [Scandinavium goeteborgense]|uniref:phage tail protein n=1 Tax=Scandinavium goeteborgense TaxID=1851514 RepID=UPI0015724C2F|nr:phage tail protein [Scandinavium goeteborgense]QKN82188.1 phage tail protein [Scandinavium goeteborgense]
MIIDPLAILESQYSQQFETLSTPLPPLLMWGDFIFQLSTLAYNKLTISDAWTWAAQGRIGRQDRLQYTGKKTPTMRFDCELYADFVDMTGLSDVLASTGSWQAGQSDPVEWLRRQANSKTPMMLVTGSGLVMGFWVMTQLEQAVDEFRGAGEFRHQNVTLSLQYFGKSLSGVDDDAPAEVPAPTAATSDQAVSEMNAFLSEHGNG